MFKNNRRVDHFKLTIIIQSRFKNNIKYAKNCVWKEK
jgi:hypothetical protein